MSVSVKRIGHLGLGAISLGLCVTLGSLLCNQSVKGDECEEMLLTSKCNPDRLIGPLPEGGIGELTPAKACDQLPKAVVCNSYLYTEGQDQLKQQTVPNSYSRVRILGVENIICSIDYKCELDANAGACKNVFVKNNTFGVTKYQSASCDPSNPNAPWPPVEVEEKAKEKGAQ
jgi:hypothetical protein